MQLPVINMINSRLDKIFEERRKDKKKKKGCTTKEYIKTGIVTILKCG